MAVDTNVPESMEACQVVKFNAPYKIHTIPVPSHLSEHDLLVKVAVASLCHTDFMVSSGLMGTTLPCTASHEGSGTVVLTGSSVTTFHPGDRIMCGLPFHQCNRCPDCLSPESYKQYCPNLEGHIGVTVDGAFAEYVKVDSRTCAVLPDTVSFETAAPLACAGTTVFRGVLQAALKKGEWLGIVGSGGGLGHLGIQFAKALGYNVVAIDAREEGLALSKEHHADVVVDARKGIEKVVEEVHKVTGGAGVDATLNLSDAESAAGTACAVTRMHGTVVQIAQPPTVNIPFAELVFRDIRIRGSLISSLEEAKYMLRVVAEHNISVQTNPFNGLKEIPKLIELAESGKMKGKGIVIVDKTQIDEERKGVSKLV